MNRLHLLCTARSIENSDTEYRPLDNYNLLVSDSEASRNALSVSHKLIIKNNSDKPFKGIIHIIVVSETSAPKFFMPGYLYNRNTADMPSSGRKAFPRVKENASKLPESSFFMTRADRLSEPVSLVYDNGRIFGISASPYLVKDKKGIEKPGFIFNDDSDFYKFCGFSMDLNGYGQGTSAAGYTLGYENAPWLFIQTARVYERAELSEKNVIELLPDGYIETEITVYDYKADNEEGIYKAIEDTYYRFHEAPRTIPGMNAKKAVGMLSSAIRDYAWLENENMYSGFVYDRPEGFAYNKLGSLTWTNGLSVVTPLLLAANIQKDERLHAQCIKFINEVISHAFNPETHLLYEAVNDGKWSTRGWWYDGMHSGGHSAYLNGQAVYYMLKAYMSEKAIGFEHKDWLQFVRPVIEQFNKVINTDYEYPFSMSEKTGAGIEYDSLGSSWCLAATALFALITGERSTVELMKKSELHYYDTFVSKAECYGGPLDTDKAVDNEGILAYIRAVRLLHELTGDKLYLVHMGSALNYEASFKLGYNTPVAIPPLSTIGWSSCGGSITSVANPHIHPMSSTIIDEMNYYVAHTGNEYIADRLRDTIGWSLQTFNTSDKEYGYGKAGWMSERFCFCEGLVVEKYPDGSPAGTWFALMPWAAASLIEGLVGL